MSLAPSLFSFRSAPHRPFGRNREGGAAMKRASFALAALLVASCKGPPTFDDGTYVAWVETGSASSASDAADSPPITWSSKPSNDELRAAYPRDRKGTIGFEFRCQVRRETALGKCALTGTDPETDELRAIGTTLADRFVVPVSALSNRSAAAPFALVQVTVCKRAAARTVLDVGTDDECIPVILEKKADESDEVPAGAAQGVPANAS